MAILLGCGPGDRGATSECEVDPAVPLLSLPANEQAELAGRTDEGWVFEVATYSLDVGDILGEGPDASWPDAIATRVVGIAACGAAPELIAEDVVDVRAPPRADLPWIAQSPTGSDAPGLWLLDPIGGAPPQRLTNGSVEDVVWFDGGVIVLDGGDDVPRQLVRIDVGADGRVTKTVIRDGVRAIVQSIGDEPVRSVIAVVTDDRELVVLDPGGGDDQIVATEVAVATSSDAEARVFIVHGSARSFVLDRASGLEIMIGDGGGSFSADGAVTSDFRDTTLEETHIILLPEVRELRLPGYWDCTGGCTPGKPARVLHGPDGMYRLDTDAETPEFIHPGEHNAIVTDDAMYVFELLMEDFEIGWSSFRHHIRRMRFDGSSFEDVLGESAIAALPLSDDRWAYLRVVDSTPFAELVVLDRASSDRVEHEGRVLATVGPWYDEFVDRFEHPRDDFLYWTIAEGSGENIVWLAHGDRLLAP